MHFVHIVFEAMSHLSTKLVKRALVFMLLLLVWDSFSFHPGGYLPVPPWILGLASML